LFVLHLFTSIPSLVWLGYWWKKACVLLILCLSFEAVFKWLFVCNKFSFSPCGFLAVCWFDEFITIFGFDDPWNGSVETLILVISTFWFRKFSILAYSLFTQKLSGCLQAFQITDLWGFPLCMFTWQSYYKHSYALMFARLLVFIQNLICFA